MGSGERWREMGKVQGVVGLGAYCTERDGVGMRGREGKGSTS